MKKIRKKWQLLLYAAAGMGVNLLNLMMGSYLCSALLVGGFGEAAIKNQTFEQKDLVVAALWAVFVLVSKIVDGVIDIPMASLTDRMKTRWGRRRPSLVLGLVPMVLAYAAFALFTPDKSGVSVLNTVYYGVILCVFYSSYTLTMVTYYATYTEIVDNEPDRSFMSNVKAVCDIFYFIIGYVAVVAMLKGMNLRPVAMLVLPLVLLMLIPLFMIKERPGELGETGQAQSVNLVRSIAHTFKNVPFIVWMLVYSFMQFGVQLFLGGINEYFSFTGMSMMYVMMASFAPVPFTLLLYNLILRKKGFGVAFRYTLILFILGMMSLFGVAQLEAGTTKTVLSIAAGVLSSFSIGSLFAVAYSVPSQLAAEEEEKTGVSNSAMYFAVQGLFAGVSTGIGTGLALTFLKQTEGAMNYLTVVAAAGTLVALVLTFVLPRSIQMMGKKSK